MATPQYTTDRGTQLSPAPPSEDIKGPRARELEEKKRKEDAKKQIAVAKSALDLTSKAVEADVDLSGGDATGAAQMDPSGEQGPEEHAGKTSQEILFEMLKTQGPNEQQQALYQQMADVQQQDAERQSARIQQEQALYEKIRDKPVGKDLSDIVRGVDMLTGSNLSATYKPPRTEEDREKQLLEMREFIGQREGQLSKTQLEQLNTLFKMQERDNQSKKLALLYKDSLNREKRATTKADRDLAKADSDQLKKSKFGVDILNKVEKHHTVKDAEKVLNEAANLRRIVEIGGENPIAAAAVPTFMARVAGEVGNLSEADKRPFGGDRSIITRMEQALQTWSQGTLTPENKEFLMEFITVLENNKGKLLNTRKRTLVDQYHSAQTMFGKDELYAITGVSPEEEQPPAPGGPAVGDVVGGYKYTGGDPASSKSWVKQ